MSCSPPAPSPAACRAAEAVRVLEGTPRYGVDLGERDLPQETSQTRALHFAKGCYLGQEIVERIRSRGAVHRRLAQFTLSRRTGRTPARAHRRRRDRRRRPHHQHRSQNGTRYGLGIVRTEAVVRHPVLDYPGGTATLVTHPPLARSAPQTS